MTLENVQAFACVDQACDPHALVRFLETAAARYFGPLNARSYDLLRLAPGASVLIFSCFLLAIRLRRSALDPDYIAALHPGSRNDPGNQILVLYRFDNHCADAALRVA